MKEAIVEQQIKILELHRQGFSESLQRELTISLKPTSILGPPQLTTLSNSTREVPPHLSRSEVVSPPHSIRSPPYQPIYNPPMIQQPAPQCPPPTSVVSPPSGCEPHLGYANIPHNCVPAQTRHRPRRLPQEARSPPLVANPPHNSEPIAMAVPEPQSQEASQVSQPSRASRALSDPPPPSKYITGDEDEYWSDVDSSQYDELGAFTTPPSLAKGTTISDDFVDDPLMTPPGNCVARDMTGVGSWFGWIDGRRELPQHRPFPFSASRQENALDTEGDNLDGPTPVPTPSTKHNQTESLTGPSMIPAQSDSIWGGSNAGISEPVVRPPPSSIRVSGFVWRSSVKNEEPVTIRAQNQPSPKLSLGSVWGGITKDEDGVRDGDNASFIGNSTRSGLDDVKLSRKRTVPLEDTDVQKAPNRKTESASTPTSAESAANISDSTNLRNEKPVPPLPTPEGAFFCGYLVPCRPQH